MKDEQKALMELHKNLQKGLSWEDLFLQPNMTNETLQQLLDCGLIEYRGHMGAVGITYDGLMNIEYIIKLSDTAVSLLKHVYASILGQIHNSSPRPIVGEPLSIDPITNDEEREALNELIRIGYLKCGALGTTHNLMVTQRGEDYLMALNAVPFRPI